MEKIIAAFLFAHLAVASTAFAETSGITSMTVTSSGIIDGKIADRYGKRGDQFNPNGIPSYSIPIKIENAPAGTVSFATVIEDKDAFPVSEGFSWVHWTAANITRNELKDNESLTATDFVQGANSWISPQGGGQSVELSSYYGGMAPPEKPFPGEYPEHVYEIHVYALDKKLDLKKGFGLNRLYREMEGHVLAEYTLKGGYSK